MNRAVEKTIQDGDVLVREHGALRRLTLNRPKALNALTLDMAATMASVMALSACGRLSVMRRSAPWARTTTSPS